MDMTNVLAGLKLLRNAGYNGASVHDHTVVAIDPVSCRSGKLEWTEHREVPINVSKGLDQVHHFINERE